MSPDARMVVADLDGTIASKGNLFPSAVSALAELGGKGILRIVATGRSLHGARKVLGPDFPIDYLVFSSGAGILDWRTGAMLKTHSLEREAAEKVLFQLREARLSFMCHDPIPENHCFSFFEGVCAPEDFHRRLERNKEHARAQPEVHVGGASQFLVVVENGAAAEKIQWLRGAFPGLSIIRATSPLDGRSAWLEIFPGGVSKSSACDWVASREEVNPRSALAVGDDYNDSDLLGWAGTGAWVGSVPEEIKSGLPCYSSRDRGFLEAVTRWLCASKRL